MDPALNLSDLGLHRGRRVLAAGLSVVALALGVWVFAPAPQPSPPLVIAPEVAPLPKPSRRVKGPRSAAVVARAAPPRAAPIAAVTVVPPPAAEPVQPTAKPEWAVPPPEPEIATALEPPPPVPPAEPADVPVAVDDGNGEAIANQIADDRRVAVRDCFERELKQDPKLSGTVTVELDLRPPNLIHAVRVNDDLDRPTFSACVADAMQHPHFAGLNEEVSVRVPYVLSAAAK